MRDYSKIKWDKLLYYDETSPSCLRWKVDLYHSRIGYKIRSANDYAGTNTTRNYYYISYLGERYSAHRIVYVLCNGDVPAGSVVDHIDGNPANNLISNLRLVSQKTNIQNRQKRSDNKSGVTGVWLSGCGIKQSWETNWTCFLSGKLKSKKFSTNKYGYDEAFRLACEYRSMMIEKQNSLGADYSERHGL